MSLHNCRPPFGRTLIERSPLGKFTWIVAQLAEHLTVNEAVIGSNPIDPPSLRRSPPATAGVLLGAVAERRMHFAVDEDDDGSSPLGPANFQDV